MGSVAGILYAASMNRHYRGNHGFAIVVVLLVSVVALGAIVTSASLAALSARQVASYENAASVALLAAESGLNTLMARSKLEAYAFDGHDSVASWLGGFDGQLASYDLPNGASVSLSVVGSEANGIATIRAVGTARDGSSQRAVLQDFDIALGDNEVPLFSDAALVTKTALSTNARVSRLIGLSEDEADWKFSATLGQAQDGEYVEIGSGDDLSRYRVSVQAGQYSLDLVSGAGFNPSDSFGEPICDIDDIDADRMECPLSLPVTLIPYAVTESYGAPVPARIFVTNTEPYTARSVEADGSVTPGTSVWLGGTTHEDSNRGTVVAIGVDESDRPFLEVEWSPSPSGVEVSEGDPVRKVVLSAIAEGGCPDDKQHTDEKMPQGCEEQELDDLWANTFGGISKTTMRDVAMTGEDDNALAELGLPQDQYDDWVEVERAHYDGGDWPFEVTGLTWIDGAQTKGRNNALCGSGIVILNTGMDLDDDPDDRINLTTQGCEFRGVLYVIGQLKLVGNLDNFEGAVFVEGPGGITEAEGTGDKALYNPIAVREALGLLPSTPVVEGLFAGRPNTFRLSNR